MVSPESWTHKFSESFKNAETLYDFLGWELTEDLRSVAATYPVFIPRALAEKIRAQGPEGVLAKEFLPHFLEVDGDLKGLTDPIGDRTHQRAPQLVHRYESRALFTPTSVCPVHCRYCFRKNELTPGDELFEADFEKTLAYLREHPEINEVIFTGGDPLTLSNQKLENYLLAFSKISSIRHVRLHTRYPVILPERIDHGLLGLLDRASDVFQTVTLAIHANHSAEFDAVNEAAIKKLAWVPVQLLSQTVLLKGINDEVPVLTALIEKFLSLKVRPYYLHHPDQVKGGMHFYLPLQRGREIYGELRQLLPGWALPHYVIDVPGGHGKVPAFNPEGKSYSGQLLSRTGEAIRILEPDLIQ